MNEFLVNNRTFYFDTVKNKMGNVVFSRNPKNEKNISDISSCAALAMHKAVIGLCELSALEEAETKTGRSLRVPKAVQTYYIIYHLFCSCMLLDKDYKMVFQSKNRQIRYGTELKNLKEKPNEPEEWNSRKYLESDLAVRIKHKDIKDYCKSVRKKKGRSKENHTATINMTLYNAFIRKDCEVVLFEKVDYIRDRSVYRPSFVASLTDTPIQTSENVRSQVDSLPDSNKLFDVLRGIHYEICSHRKNNYYVGLAMAYCQVFAPGAYFVNCSAEYAEKLGYSWPQLEEFGGNNELRGVPMFVAQAMELFRPEELQEYYCRFWKPLFDDMKNA